MAHHKKGEHAGDRTLDLGRIETWDRNSYFDQKKETAPLAGTRRKHGRGRPR